MASFNDMRHLELALWEILKDHGLFPNDGKSLTRHSCPNPPIAAAIVERVRFIAVGQKTASGSRGKYHPPVAKSPQAS
jgi:hypothetical protein